MAVFARFQGAQQAHPWLLPGGWGDAAVGVGVRGAAWGGWVSPQNIAWDRGEAQGLRCVGWYRACWTPAPHGSPCCHSGNKLQSIWLTMQEKQRKIQEEAAPGSQEADPSGKAWEDSPWAPSMTRDVPATAQQAEPLAFGPRPLGLLLWAPLHGWADCGQCTGWGRAWAQEADPLGSDPCSATCWVTLGRPFDLSVLWFLHLSRGDETVTYPKACL